MSSENENQSQLSEEYVPWSQGAEVLGIGRGSFYNLVETGQIRELPERTRRNRRFNLEDILRIKERRMQGKPRKQYKKRPAPVVIDWLKAEDMPSCLRLDQIVYDEIYLAEAAVYQSWRKKNGHLSFAAFDAKDRNICLGYAGLIPLPEHVCIDILRGVRDDKSITVDEVESYSRPGAYVLLAISAVTHKDRPDLLYALLYHHMHFWIDMYPERYIKKIYAQAVTQRGELLVQHLFMAPRPDLAYNAYELDLARPAASKVIRRFKEQLAEKAPLSPDLQWPPPERQ